MANDIFVSDYYTRHEMHLNAIVQAAREVYNADSQASVRILDLATGPNEFNPFMIQRLSSASLDYELVLSDISPVHLEAGYENIKEEVTSEELSKVKCVLADSRDLRRPLLSVPMWGKGEGDIEEVLKTFDFLASGYEKGRRVENFEDESFDLVIGCVPYSSINTGSYGNAIDESVRVLRKGGYHIVVETEVIQINEGVERDSDALARAKIRYVEDIAKKLDGLLVPVTILSTKYDLRGGDRNPEQTLQDGDVIRDSVIIHRK